MTIETDNEDTLQKLIMEDSTMETDNEDSMETDNEDSLQKLIMKIHYRN